MSSMRPGAINPPARASFASPGPPARSQIWTSRGQQGYPLLLRSNLGLPPGERRETHRGHERNVPWAAML